MKALERDRVDGVHDDQRVGASILTGAFALGAAGRLYSKLITGPDRRSSSEGV